MFCINECRQLRQKRIMGQNFAAYICISFSRDRFIGKWHFSPCQAGQEVHSSPACSSSLSREDKPLPEQVVPAEEMPAWELGSQHCQRSALAAPLKGRPQDAKKPGKGKLRDSKQTFAGNLVCFEFFPKNIVILMNQHLQVEKKETILLFYHEVMNFLFLLTKVSKHLAHRHTIMYWIFHIYRKPKVAYEFWGQGGRSYSSYFMC